jgi:hypothetical protein
MENRDTLVVENVVKPLSAYYEIKSEDDKKSIENLNRPELKASFYAQKLSNVP